MAVELTDSTEMLESTALWVVAELAALGEAESAVAEELLAEMRKPGGAAVLAASSELRAVVAAELR